MGTEVIPKSEEAVPAEAPSEIELKIIQQIEYYFGNYNLSRDKFLKQQLTEDEGWIPLEVLIKFNRLKKLTEDFHVITEALKKSPKQLMEISEDCKKVRRRSSFTPLPDDHSERVKIIDERTLYVKGFKKTNTLDELMDFFKDSNVEHIFMRRINHQNNKPFRGSVFATFETKEDAEKFFEKKGIKYNGTELLKEWKVDYVKRKDEYYTNLKAEKEKKALKKAGMLKEENANGEKVPKIEMIPGCLLKLSNLENETTRELIKDVFEPLGDLVYVDYAKGKPLAVLRFSSGIASSVREKLTEKDGEWTAKIGSCTAVVTLIEGDEEKEYWNNIAVSRAQSRQKFKGNRNFGNKGRFKKWGGKRQKGRDEDENDAESVEPAKKKIKSEPDSKEARESTSAKDVSPADE